MKFPTGGRLRDAVLKRIPRGDGTVDAVPCNVAKWEGNSYIRYENFPGFDLPKVFEHVNLLGIQAIIGRVKSEDLLAFVFIHDRCCGEVYQSSVLRMQRSMVALGRLIAGGVVKQMMRTIPVSCDEWNFNESWIPLAMAAEDSGLAGHFVAPWCFKNARPSDMGRQMQLRAYGRLFARVVGLIALERGHAAAETFASCYLRPILRRYEMAPGARTFVAAILRTDVARVARVAA